jgi:hypothetical protein
MNNHFGAGSHSTGYADRPFTKAAPWHGLVVVDLLLNNIASGLFLVTALGELAAPTVVKPVATAAYPLALVLLFADLACLVLDLGDPLRFHHMLRVFKPSSPMSLGTWSLAAFSLPLTAIVATELLPGSWAWLTWVRLAAVLFGLLPAFLVALYKGVLLSTSAQPGWKDARWLGAYLATSAVMLGCAVLLLLSILLNENGAAAILHRGLALLLVLNGIVLGLLIRNLVPALATFYSQPQSICLGGLALGGGMLLPLCLLLVASGPQVRVGAVVLVLLGSLLGRYVILEIPQRLSTPA